LPWKLLRKPVEHERARRGKRCRIRDEGDQSVSVDKKEQTEFKTAPPAGSSDPEPTVELLTRVKTGDSEALDHLLRRCLPALKRWTHGRLPSFARGTLDTDDLVQESVFSALGHIDGFEPRHAGAFQGYLKKAVQNRIHDEVRKVGRRGVAEELPADQSDAAPSPEDEAVATELMERYAAALERLRPEDRDAVIARVEWQYSFEELAQALSKPSVDAARMTFARALDKLAIEMGFKADKEPGPGIRG
jgi:RNA polymerase sigma-70 factor (ECF subfamily)